MNAGLDPPLHIAIRRKDSLMARLLLQAGADYDVKDSVKQFQNFLFDSLF